jgi:hypothetical protein
LPRFSPHFPVVTQCLLAVSAIVDTLVSFFCESPGICFYFSAQRITHFELVSTLYRSAYSAPSPQSHAIFLLFSMYALATMENVRLLTRDAFVSFFSIVLSFEAFSSALPLLSAVLTTVRLVETLSVLPVIRLVLL